MFTQNDVKQIVAHGLTLEEVEHQINDFRHGFDTLPVNRAAVDGDGILKLNNIQALQYVNLYKNASEGMNIVKFVPASGAATRMFKELFEFVNENKDSSAIEILLSSIERFAFYDDLRSLLNNFNDPKRVVSAIIKSDGLNYGALPKALIKFHKYDNGGRTAAEEHLVEGAMYAECKGVVNIHFTVSGEHLEGFRTLFARVLPVYEQKFGVHYNISFSQQKSSTDTIAVLPDNTPFRESDGSLLFRPAGHGALLANLGDINADLIFVKNIDNIAPDRLKPDTVTYKQALAGILIELQQGIFDLRRRMDSDNGEVLLSQIAAYVEDKLYYKLPLDFSSRKPEDRSVYLQHILDRPLRVCGVVLNEGEPGGGPFWVNMKDGAMALQIAESSQIAAEDMDLMKRATHFNPVDLVCATKNYRGERFDLSGFTDPDTGFISLKSKDGKQLKALEIPGLWNGAMANWSTVMVEVPITTFSPVKSVCDLLRPQHQ